MESRSIQTVNITTELITSKLNSAVRRAPRITPTQALMKAIRDKNSAGTGPSTVMKAANPATIRLIPAKTIPIFLKIILPAIFSILWAVMTGIRD